MKDSLGARMKEQYEWRSKFLLPRRTYTILRVDGKAFHSYTKGLSKPFDYDLMEDMSITAKALCEGIQGAKFAYLQSDEISVLITDFESAQTQAWFDGNVQKMTSISAALATATFNKARIDRAADQYEASDGSALLDAVENMALFDSRVFVIPDAIEVENYFIWRQQDASRNSIQMAVRSVYSHGEVDGKNSEQMHDMLHDEGINWHKYPVHAKRGGMIIKAQEDKFIEETGQTVTRNVWRFDEPPIFTKDRSYLESLIPFIHVQDYGH